MKIFSAKAVISAVIICCYITACNSASNTDLKGKWTYAQWTMAGSQVDLANMGNPVIDFKEGGEFTVVYGDQSNTEKWKVSGDTLRFDYKDGKYQTYLMTPKGSDTLELEGKAGNIDTHLVLVRKND